MAFAIKNDVIYITRGDDAELTVTILGDDGTEYTMQTGDQLTLTVRALPDSGSDVLVNVTSNTNTLPISHSASSIDVGKYSADIQLTTNAGKRKTVWPSVTDTMTRMTSVKNFANFIVLPEVTTNG